MQEEALALAIYETHRLIQAAFLANDLEVLTKENVARKALGLVPAKWRGGITFTGDNWAPDNLGRYPDLTSSIALVARDGLGRVTACAMAPARDVWQQKALVAVQGKGVFVLGERDLVRISGVDNRLLDWVPCEAVIFGKKSTEHWVEMNRVIANLNALGIRTQNDCGPYYAMKEFFTVVSANGVATPNNVAYVEPYLVKSKDELTAWVINCLNETLPAEQRFVLTDMAGNPIFREGAYEKEPGIGVYQGVGFVAIPFPKSYMLFMAYLRKAMGDVPSFVNPDNAKMVALAESLRRWK
ncbi:MAG: hypothetical protein Q7S70_02120 [bacterium]|nr:hypothetical protein [bacterium]